MSYSPSLKQDCRLRLGLLLVNGFELCIRLLLLSAVLLTYSLVYFITWMIPYYIHVGVMWGLEQILPGPHVNKGVSGDGDDNSSRHIRPASHYTFLMVVIKRLRQWMKQYYCMCACVWGALQHQQHYLRCGAYVTLQQPCRGVMSHFTLVCCSTLLRCNWRD